MSGFLRVEREGPVATVVLDHERRRNALSKHMWSQFGPLLTDLADDASVKVVVLRGAGEHFSAGADITDLHDILNDPQAGSDAGGHATAGEDAVARFPKPTVAAIDGYCVGGGWQIAAACDIRIATDRAQLGITPAKIGIIYPLSGINRLVKLVGPAVAKYLLFSGDLVPAPEAKHLGLVTHVVPHSRFLSETEGLSRRLASRSQLSIHAMKQIVDGISAGDQEIPELHARWERETAVSGESEIGIQAFLEKQPPRFSWLSGTPWT